MENSNEAPTSVTYSLITPNGFPVLFTMRDEKVGELMHKMDVLEPSLITKGYKPQEKRSFGERKPFVPQPSASGNKCPKCGSPMAMSKAGKEYCSKLCWKDQTTGSGHAIGIPTVINNDFKAF